MTAFAKFSIVKVQQLISARLAFSVSLSFFWLSTNYLSAQDALAVVKPRPNTEAFERKIPADEWPARIATGQTIDGVIEGEVVYKTHDGKTLLTEEYLHGELHGCSRSFYPDGKIQSETRYVYGERHGESKKYWPNGKLFFKGNFRNGQAHGRQCSYFDNGKLSGVAQAEMGLFQGERVHYTTKEVQFGVSIWKDGVEIARRQTGELDQREADAIERRLMYPDLASLWAESKPVRK